MDKCDLCGSDRMFEVDPQHEPGAHRCMDCGSQYNREVIREPEPSAISVANPIPAEGFSTVAEAAAFLEQLKASKKGLSKQREDRPSKSHPVSDTDPNIVFAAYHFYQRVGESFSEVLSTAKGERAVRNFNTLIWAHNHIISHQCTKSCREIISE